MAMFVAAVFCGAMLGQLLAPQPATAVSREIIELQQQVQTLITGQQDMRSAFDQKTAELRTLISQALDAQNRMATEMGAVQKTVQDSQANSGARVDTLATQTQGISDNMQDMQSRVGKLSQQLTDVQNLLQSIDAKIPGGTAGGATGTNPGGTPNGFAQPPAGSVPPSSALPPATSGGGAPIAAGPPVSSDTLYQNALRDFNSGRYDLSRQEFGDFLRNFPTTDLAGNAEFYLGEIDYAQGNYQEALSAYDTVLTSYPKSYKIAPASLKKGEAYLALGQKTTAARQFRVVVAKYPGTDEARRAEVHLKELTPRAAGSGISRQ
jgi:tol-pal system protein YbgF